MPTHESDPNARRSAWLVLAIALAVRLVAAVLVPLAPDETYYWEWSRRLAAGYLDHPPAIALLVRAGTLVLGATPIGVRLCTLLAGALASAVLVRISGTLGGDRAMLRAAAIIACMPLAQIGLALATPDASLLLFWSLALAALIPALRDESTPHTRVLAWMLLGLAIGCALSSKYTALLLLAGIAVGLTLQPSLRGLLATPGPYLALTIAIAVLAPNLAWNARHGWASLSYQLAHGLATHRGTALGHETRLLGAQIGLVTPLLLAMLAAAVYHALRDRRDPLRTTFAVIASITWLFFVASALRAAVEPNWQAPAYLSAIVLAASGEGAARWDEGRARIFVRASLVLAAATTLLIYVHAVFPFMPVDPARDSTGAGFGWSTLAARVNAARSDAPRTITTWVGGERYQEASELAFHLPDHPVTFVIDVNGRPNQYDLWPSFAQRARTGDRLILVLGLFARPEDDPVIAALSPHFVHVTLREVVALRRGSIVRAFRRVWVLDGWRGSWPQTGLAH
ncbi:MAG: ArnT family glycosyltransferase [Gemmatimonas sp.]|nr:glycosyltransferase family 39 protein [Gemmatimonadaceae bacterium]